jgi:hypothetical protein
MNEVLFREFSLAMPAPKPSAKPAPTAQPLAMTPASTNAAPIAQVQR